MVTVGGAVKTQSSGRVGERIGVKAGVGLVSVGVGGVGVGVGVTHPVTTNSKARRTVRPSSLRKGILLACFIAKLMSKE